MKQSYLFGLLVGSAFALAASFQTAFALKLPYKSAIPASQHRYDDQLYGYAWTAVAKSGVATVYATFSNSRNWKRDRRMVIAVSFMQGKKTVEIVTFDETLNPGMRGTKEVHRSKTIKMKPEVWAKINKITYRYSEGMPASVCAFYKKKYQNGQLRINPCAP